jgi:hypothetical protein
MEVGEDPFDTVPLPATLESGFRMAPLCAEDAIADPFMLPASHWPLGRRSCAGFLGTSPAAHARGRSSDLDWARSARTRRDNCDVLFDLVQRNRAVSLNLATSLRMPVTR